MCIRDSHITFSLSHFHSLFLYLSSYLCRNLIQTMSYQFINFSIEDHIATIQFNRPEVYNSIHQRMAYEIQKALESCKSDELARQNQSRGDVRCVVITGSGKAFCAGQDLKEVVDPNGPKLQNIVKDHYNPIIRAIRSLDLPVICAVNGVAAGAGANIALSGDIVVASNSASFVQAFSKIGLIPDSGGTFFLPRLVGWNRASALMMTGDKVNAEAAMNLSLIHI